MYSVRYTITILFIIRRSDPRVTHQVRYMEYSLIFDILSHHFDKTVICQNIGAIPVCDGSCGNLARGEYPLHLSVTHELCLYIFEHVRLPFSLTLKLYLCNPIRGLFTFTSTKYALVQIYEITERVK